MYKQIITLFIIIYLSGCQRQVNNQTIYYSVGKNTEVPVITAQRTELPTQTMGVITQAADTILENPPTNVDCPNWNWNPELNVYLISPGVETQEIDRDTILLVNADTQEEFLLEYSGFRRATAYFWHPDNNAIGVISLGNVKATVDIIDLESCLVTSRVLQHSDFEFQMLDNILTNNLGSYQVNNPSFPMIPLYAFHPKDSSNSLYYVRADWAFDQSDWISPDGRYLVLNAGFLMGTHPFPSDSLTITDLEEQEIITVDLPEIENHHTLTWLLSWSNDSSTLAIDNFLYHFDTGQSETLVAEIYPPYEFAFDDGAILFNGSYPPFFYSFYMRGIDYFIDGYDYNSSPCSYQFSNDEVFCFTGIRDFHHKNNKNSKIAFYNLEWLDFGNKVAYSYYEYSGKTPLGGGYCIYTVLDNETQCLTDNIPEMIYQLDNGDSITKDVVHVAWNQDEAFAALMVADSCPLCEYAFSRQIILTDLGGTKQLIIDGITYPGLWKP